MLMALHPEVQEKCQKELDQVLGPRNPTIDDMSKLVYIMATLMEIQRFSKVAPGSLPHVTTQDTVVQGYKFKTGTTFMCNLTKFLDDPKVFPEPDKFIVDRFLDETGQKLRKYDQFAPFGIGKRICMGESLAKNEMFIFFVRVIQRLKVGVATPTYPKPDPNSYTAGITRIPNAFYVTVNARSSS
jgi:cytochrome P450